MFFSFPIETLRVAEEFFPTRRQKGQDFQGPDGLFKLFYQLILSDEFVKSFLNLEIGPFFLEIYSWYWYFFPLIV
jgi:hypothetical protein